MGLFETLGETLASENSLLSRSLERARIVEEKEKELRSIAEDATKLVVDSDSPHYRNYVLMYMLGYQDCELKRRSNLLEYIEK